MLLLRFASGLLALLSLSGCVTEKITHIASVYVEAPESTTQTMRKFVTLPVSGITIPIMTKELTLAEDLLGTDAIETGPPDLRVTSLLLHLNTTAARNVMEITRQARGRQLVLVINEAAVGLMPVDGQIVNGKLIFHVEQKGMSSREAVLFLSEKLNASTLLIRKELEKQ